MTPALFPIATLEPGQCRQCDVERNRVQHQSRVTECWRRRPAAWRV